VAGYRNMWHGRGPRQRDQVRYFAPSPLRSPS
jgi:hypothetical protein